MIGKNMTTTTTKQRVLNQVFAALPKAGSQRATADASAETPAVLEQFLYAVCREGVTRDRADRAYRALQERFFDWNEVRVSASREVAEALAGLPAAESRANRLIGFLQEVFETTFSFDLELLQKKGLKQAAKQLARYQAANDYAVAWVIQQSLGGHSIPLDGPSLRVLRRLGLLEGDSADLEALRASLEHQIPKAKGAQFIDLISAVAEEFCWEDGPACPSCPFASSCPSRQDAKSTEGGRPHKSR
jgi:endonuclease-3